jgi:indole-3-glycerol phosphate synthase
VQAIPTWAPPSGTLGQIVAEAAARVDELKRRSRDLEAAAERARDTPSMARALRRSDVAVLAEIKRRSPSRGPIKPDLAPVLQAEEYVAGGAAGISILTEPRHFGGSADDLRVVRGHVSVPLLKKDFHIDPVQLLEARALGASAVLLIARALEPRNLNALFAEARALRLEVVAEVRTEAELDLVLSAGAEIVGVNSRDLETLAVDFAVPERLIPRIPSALVAVVESGVTSRRDVERVAAWGADAVLVGSALSAAADPRAAVAELTGVHRASRGP